VLPPVLPNITRVSSLKILGVTFPVEYWLPTTYRMLSFPVRKHFMLYDCSTCTACLMQRYRWFTKLLSSPGCCMLQVPVGVFLLPLPSNTSRDAYAMVCEPDTAVRMNSKPPSWSKT